MKIELLKAEDIDLYKDLIDEVFGSSNNIEKYREYRGDKGYRIFVVKAGDLIIGSATQYPIELFTFDFQPSLMIFNVAVRESYRKQNIAKMLLEHIIENAKKEGYRSISLTCLETAYPAHRLYKSLGFEKANSLKFNLNLITP